MATPKTLLIMVDGLGLGTPDPAVNLIHSGICPVLEDLLKNHAVPIDAQLGVPGLPQSATGQATLLTGINAAFRMGRHVEGFPGPELRALIEEHNILGVLRRRGYTVTFANAYFVDDVSQVRSRRWQSVTTVATLAGTGTVRDTTLMLRNEAVYQDLTRRVLRERGYAGPLITPAEAGKHLLQIAERYDFTLFEFFQTDRAGHSGHRGTMMRVLGEFDEFLAVVASFATIPGHLFLLTSDHGNIEDASTRQHTFNPVPLVAVGEGADLLRRQVRALDQFAPILLKLFDDSNRSS